MPSNYKRLGDYIHKVENRNRDLKVSNLVGLSMTKEFRVSTSNIVGTDMSVYKIVNKWQFSCDFMSVIRVHKFPVVLKTDDEPVLVSPAYTVFEVNDQNKLNPEYLMMWFRRSEFDRYADFKCDSAIRGGFDWDALCDCLLPIPTIEKQREIVREYHTIQNRIVLNNQLISKLEETAQGIYKQWFVDSKPENKILNLEDITDLITDGKHGNSEDQENSGFYFLSAKDVRSTLIYENSRQITKKDFVETHKRTDLKHNDICLVNTGATIGRMCLAPDNPKTSKTTFQKSVAIIKPKENFSTGQFLYCLLKDKMESLIELGKGTSQANLLLGDLKKFELEYPGYEIVSQFEKITTPVFKLFSQKIEENQKLEEFKELLLARMTKVEAKVQNI